MESERPVDDTLLGAAPWRLWSWKASFVMGLATLILGLIVAFRPSGSLVVISVLLGILMIFSGVFHIIAALDGPADHRIWRAIAGVVFIVAGVVLMRHLEFSLALIGLIVGFSWVIQGLSALIGGITHRGGWSIFFGIVSLIAGIVVISVPVSSIVFLTTFLGIWFAVIGVFEMTDAWMSRHLWDTTVETEPEPVSVPGPRAESDVPDTEAAGGSPTGRNVQG
jgi:uncharacterized membrane protein HdeD (DUF308 family)